MARPMFEETRYSPMTISPRWLARKRQCRRLRADAGCPCRNALHCPFLPAWDVRTECTDDEVFYQYVDGAMVEVAP